MKNRSSALAVIVAVLLIGCLLGVAGYHFFEKESQRSPSLHEMQKTQAHAGRLSSRLQLTNEQDAMLKEILEDSRKQINAGSMEWDAKLRDIRTKTNERISAILTDEQKKIFTQIMNESQFHGGGRSHGGGHGGR